MMTLEQFNALSVSELRQSFTQCCGATAWVNAMVQYAPFTSVESLLQLADNLWQQTAPADWLEAFTHHPKIGDVASLQKKFANTAHWAAGEQSAVADATTHIIEALAEGNTLYEEKFGFIFIICATGKSAGEMLQLLQERLPNDLNTELKIAMLEQQKITRLRLQKLVS